MKVVIVFVLISIVTVLEVAAYIPQIIKLIKTKSAENISLTSWFLDGFWCMVSGLCVVGKSRSRCCIPCFAKFISCHVCLYAHFVLSKKTRKEHG